MTKRKNSNTEKFSARGDAREDGMVFLNYVSNVGNKLFRSLTGPYFFLLYHVPQY